MGLTPLLVCATWMPAVAQDLRLVDAAARQDTQSIRALLRQGVAVNARRADGATALLWAAHWNDLDTADALLRAGADVNATNDLGVTPLARASENASLPMVTRLLAAGADVDKPQTNGATPLMVAARTGNITVVETLLARGADANRATTESRQTPLMWAVSEGHRDVMRALIKAGADVHASSTRGFTPLLHAARNGDVEAARILLDAGGGINEKSSDGTQALPLAIVSGRDEFAMFLLERGADPNSSMFGVSALHAAAGNVDMWLREWLRARGIDSFGASVMGLPQNRRLPLVKALLALGADPNARITTPTTVQYYVPLKQGAFEDHAIGTGNLRGATPLWVAAFGPAPDVIRALLEAKSDPQARTEDQTTPLMVAAGLGHPSFVPGRPRGFRSVAVEESVKLLVEAGADVNAVNEASFTALHGAAFRGLNEVLQYLVEQGANINAQDFRQRTAFRIAEGAKQTFQWQEWPETAEFLRKLGADTSLGIPGRVQERQREVGNSIKN